MAGRTAPMPTFISRFVWHQLFTPDPSKAKAFYAALFGWRYRTMVLGSLRYAVIRHGHREIGGITGTQGMPFKGAGWLPVATSGELDADLRLARSVGAQMLFDPQDLGEVGCLAGFADPQGARVMFLAEELPSDQAREILPGTFYWDELATTDPPTARIFYSKLMHWEAHDHDMGMVGVYTVFCEPGANGKDMAGMHALRRGDPRPSHWTSYICVDSCDEVIERVQELDGTVSIPPTTVPGIGRFAMLIDNQGTAFATIEVDAAGRRVATGGRRRSTAGHRSPR
jgi:hypothetical protein